MPNLSVSAMKLSKSPQIDSHYLGFPDLGPEPPNILFDSFREVRDSKQFPRPIGTYSKLATDLAMRRPRNAAGDRGDGAMLNRHTETPCRTA